MLRKKARIFNRKPGRNSQVTCFCSVAKSDVRLLKGIVIKRLQTWTWPIPNLNLFEKSHAKYHCNKLISSWIVKLIQISCISNFNLLISISPLLISSWALCHLFRPLHKYRAVLLLKLQNYNRKTKIRPAVWLNLESAYHPSQAKIKILGVIVFVISIAHVRQSA